MIQLRTELRQHVFRVHRAHHIFDANRNSVQRPSLVRGNPVKCSSLLEHQTGICSGGISKAPTHDMEGNSEDDDLTSNLLADLPR